MTPGKYQEWLRTLIMFLCFSMLSACGSTQTGIKKDPGVAASWWYVNFHLAWPENQPPDFSIHSLIADRILRTVIDQHRDEITLWRFHRRAARDSAGHRFSLLFLSSDDAAQQIHQEIISNPLTVRLISQSTILSIDLANKQSADTGLIAATSDPSWSLEIQRSWPYFIQGLSESWLELIAQIRRNNSNAGEVPEAGLLEYYQRLNKTLSAQWTEHGRHAYFHHTNAIFGYEPVYIFETEALHKF
jgi:hypothetical protein